MMDSRLRAGLVELSRLMIDEAEPWWIIGSTALVLSGIDGVEPDDIDVVSSSQCLHRLLDRLNLPPANSLPHSRFRSNPYQRIAVESGTPIEVMGDLEVDAGSGFQPVIIKDCQKVLLEGSELYIPPVAEQIEILCLFGRSKDLAKVELLRRHFP